MITGVNLPMLIKLAGLRAGVEPADAGAGDARARPQRHLGRVRPAARDAAKEPPGRRTTESRRDEHATSRSCNSLGLHARAAARFVHLAGTLRRPGPRRRAGRTMDGKSIMGLLLLAAARGTAITITRRRPRRGRRRRRPGRAGRARLRRRAACASDRHRRLARHRRRPRAGRPHASAATCRFLVAADRVDARARRASTDARARRAAQLEADPRAARRRRRAGRRLAVRRAAADARRRRCWSAAPRRFVRERAAQRRVGAAARARTSLGASSTHARRSVSARAQRRRRATSSAGLSMNLRGE